MFKLLVVRIRPLQFQHSVSQAFVICVDLLKCHTILFHLFYTALKKTYIGFWKKLLVC